MVPNYLTPSPTAYARRAESQDLNHVNWTNYNEGWAREKRDRYLIKHTFMLPVFFPRHLPPNQGHYDPWRADTAPRHSHVETSTYIHKNELKIARTRYRHRELVKQL